MFCMSWNGSLWETKIKPIDRLEGSVTFVFFFFETWCHFPRNGARFSRMRGWTSFDMFARREITYYLFYPRFERPERRLRFLIADGGLFFR